MDRLFIHLREACKDEHLDLVSRSCLMELVEMRARSWASNEETVSYYQSKFAAYSVMTRLYIRNYVQL